MHEIEPEVGVAEEVALDVYLGGIPVLGCVDQSAVAATSQGRVSERDLVRSSSGTSRAVQELVDLHFGGH
jgi:hypothetical protein